MNPQTARWVVWGHRDNYNTYKHIHAGMFKALQHMGKDVRWLDNADLGSNPSFDDCVLITEQQVIKNLPIQDNCLYLVHNLWGDQRNLFKDKPVIGWGVYVEASREGWSCADTNAFKLNESNSVNLNPGSYFIPSGRTSSFQIMWATDLLPHEIQANKPAHILGKHSKVINYVGTYNAGHNADLINPFRRACEKDGYTFKANGAYTNGYVISDERAVELIRESFMAPTIANSYQVRYGYAPCRIFKNISYGQPGVTNSVYSNQLFGNRLICETDTEKLFYRAKDALKRYEIENLYWQMDEVAAKHTYINRMNDIIRASEMFLEEWKS